MTQKLQVLIVDGKQTFLPGCAVEDTEGIGNGTWSHPKIEIKISKITVTAFASFGLLLLMRNNFNLK